MPNYILRQGTTIDIDRCVLIVDPDTELIGVPASDTRNLDYAFYRVLGPDWQKSNTTVKLQSNLNDNVIEVSGKDFHHFFTGNDHDELIKFFTTLKNLYKTKKPKQPC